MIGVTFTVGTFLLFGLIPEQDHTTQYCFNYALPHLISSFLVFGLVPVLCNKISLVKRESEIEQETQTQTQNNSISSDSASSSSEEELDKIVSLEPKKDTLMKKAN
jgi:hypothetical protein